MVNPIEKKPKERPELCPSRRTLTDVCAVSVPLSPIRSFRKGQGSGSALKR
jgi:hypothetical protein